MRIGIFFTLFLFRKFGFRCQVSGVRKEWRNSICALQIPERLTAAGIVSGIGPHNEPGLTDDIAPENLRFTRLARDKPWLSRLAYRFGGFMARCMPGRLITQAMTLLPEPDRAVLARPALQEVFISMLKDAIRSGARGAQWDTALTVSRWDFRLQDIAMKVYLWYGERDRNVSPAMERYLEATLPDSDVSAYPSEGHLALFFISPQKNVRSQNLLLFVANEDH